MTRASLDKRPAEVAAMFDRTARRYDLLNDLLSGGQARLWRRAVVDAARVAPGEAVLDLGAGTGTSTVPFARRGASCVACDFSIGMLAVGMQRNGTVPGLAFAAGDALRLPFADGSFDVVTISFALRNVADVDQALAELRRVTSPGGRLLVCEFSHPPNRVNRMAFTRYLKTGLPMIARLSSNPDSYNYLAESILAWPDQAGLAARIQRAGWESVRWRNLSFGSVALHHAEAPGGLHPEGDQGLHFGKRSL